MYVARLDMFKKRDFNLLQESDPPSVAPDSPKGTIKKSGAISRRSLLPNEYVEMRTALTVLQTEMAEMKQLLKQIADK